MGVSNRWLADGASALMTVCASTGSARTVGAFRARFPALNSLCSDFNARFSALGLLS